MKIRISFRWTFLPRSVFTLLLSRTSAVAWQPIPGGILLDHQKIPSAKRGWGGSLRLISIPQKTSVLAVYKGGFSSQYQHTKLHLRVNSFLYVVTCEIREFIMRYHHFPCRRRFAFSEMKALAKSHQLCLSSILRFLSFCILVPVCVYILLDTVYLQSRAGLPQKPWWSHPALVKSCYGE